MRARSPHVSILRGSTLSVRLGFRVLMVASLPSSFGIHSCRVHADLRSPVRFAPLSHCGRFAPLCNSRACARVTSCSMGASLGSHSLRSFRVCELGAWACLGLIYSGLRPPSFLTVHSFVECVLFIIIYCPEVSLTLRNRSFGAL